MTCKLNMALSDKCLDSLEDSHESAGIRNVRTDSESHEMFRLGFMDQWS